MDYIYWGLIIILFIIAFIGLVYPIIPSVLFIFAGFLLYGFLFSFEPFNWIFWIIQGLLVLLLMGADYISNLIGVKKFGGTKAGIWGSTIGLLVGPFVIPFLGIILGPFIGAFLAEWIVQRTSVKEALKIGLGSVVGFISSIFTKGFIQLIMIIYFIWIT